MANIICFELKSVVTFSGIYYDSGKDQTILGEPLTVEDQEDWQMKILNLLGMEHRPNKSSPHFIGHLDQSTVAMFMDHIFKSLTEEAGVLKSDWKQVEIQLLNENPFHIGDSDVKKINESDLIMSFANHGQSWDLHWTQMFWFNIDNLPNSDEEEILSAELRIYKKIATPSSGDYSSSFIIKLNQNVEAGSTEPLVVEKKVRYDEQGWIVLNVTKAVKDWQYNFRSNQGLHLEIFDEDNLPRTPAEVGLKQDENSEIDNESFLVAFFKSMEDNVRRNHKFKRSALEDDHEIDEYDDEFEEDENDFRMKRAAAPGRNRNKRKHKGKKNKQYSHLTEDFTTAGSNQNGYGRDYYGGRHRYSDCNKRMLRFQNLAVLLFNYLGFLFFTWTNLTT